MIIESPVSGPSLRSMAAGNAVWLMLAAFLVGGLGWVVVDYARMLRLRSKMV